MSDFLDVGQFHKNETTGKWRFQRLGYAKRNDKGGLDIYLDALPIPTGPGQVRLSVNKRQDQDREPPRGGGGYDDMNDEVPF